MFKKFEEQNLFQIACSDIVERFKLVLFLSLILTQSLVSNTSGDLEGVFRGLMSVYIAEVFVDWIKHAFITKFNRINSSVYEKYMRVLSQDITGCRNEGLILDHTHHVSRRLGLVSLPLASVVIRLVWVFSARSNFDFSSPLGMLLMLLTFSVGLATKILTSMLLLGFASRQLSEESEGRYSDVPTMVKDNRSSAETTTPQVEDDLASIERYTLFKNRIV